jgi:gamma-glutamyltranspeptidase/glutathione hydrolase
VIAAIAFHCRDFGTRRYTFSMKRLAGILLAIALPWPAQEVATSGLRIRADRPMVSQPERAPKAMVATVHAAATDAALAILRKGGNAVDAAVAIAFVLAVVHPEAGNLGGSGYLMARMADGREMVFDYGGDSPAAARPGLYTKPEEQRVGYKSIAVPGTPAGMGLAHARLGKLKWQECLEPARKLASEGFPASQRLELILPLEAPLMKAFPDSAKVFLHGSDQPLKQGELVIQKDLSATIRRMQKHGWKEFYTGETAQRIAADMAANGGWITMEDLAAYEARETAPLRIDYRGHGVLITPPSSSGGTALAVMLNTLNQFDMKLGMEGSAAARHLQVEAMRIGFAARARLMAGAPLESLVTPEYAQQAARKISLDRATPSAAVAASTESLDTTHFTVADSFGNVITNTYTLSSFFGSKVVIRGTGVLMNNHMSAFPERDLKARQRYSSTMTPVILLRKDGTTWAAFGTPGAMTIPSTLMQIVTNLVDFKMSLRDAVEFPRVHASGPGVDAEPAALVFDVAEKLRSMGHALNPNLRSQGDVNAIVIEESGWRQGWADGRRGGVVKGF